MSERSTFAGCRRALAKPLPLGTPAAVLLDCPEHPAEHGTISARFRSNKSAFRAGETTERPSRSSKSESIRRGDGKLEKGFDLRDARQRGRAVRNRAAPRRRHSGWRWRSDFGNGV